MADENVLDFQLIREPLDTLLEATANKVEHESPPHVYAEGADAILTPLVRVAIWDFRSIRHLCDERLLGYRPELTTSIPPLTRTLADAVFTVVFLFNDLVGNTRRFFKAGWRDSCEQFRRSLEKYGADPRWSEYLQQQADFLCNTLRGWQIPPEEVADLEKHIRRWPNPGKMARHPRLSSERRAFLEYLDEWLYRRLSSQAHLSAPGLSMRGGPLVRRLWKTREARDEHLEKLKSGNALTAVTLVLTLASEIEAELKFGLAERAKYIWTMLMEHGWGEATEIYDQRYKALL
jgi:hypothetical protein